MSTMLTSLPSNPLAGLEWDLPDSAYFNGLPFWQSSWNPPTIDTLPTTPLPPSAPPSAPPSNAVKQTKRSKGSKGSKSSKRDKSLERNRIAASKCRQKKREYTQGLESRFRALAEQRSLLENETARLRCEVLSLKNEMLQHAHCNDGRVGHHLAQMMQQITHCDRPSVPVPTEPEPPVCAGAADPGHEQTVPLAETGMLEERRSSETSLTSDASSFSLDDHFDELINV